MAAALGGSLHTLCSQNASTGKVHVDRGVVVQRGAYGAFYLRAGCVAHVPWHTLWNSLQKHVTALLGSEQARNRAQHTASSDDHPLPSQQFLLWTRSRHL